MCYLIVSIILFHLFHGLKVTKPLTSNHSPKQFPTNFFFSKMLQLLTQMLLLTITLQSDLKILRLPGDDPGPDPCALTCSGSEDIEKWYNNADRASFEVRYEDCGFVTTPVVTVSLESFRPQKCTPVTIETYRSVNAFFVHTVEPRTAEQMIAEECRLNWSAFGYNC